MKLKIYLFIIFFSYILASESSIGHRAEYSRMGYIKNPTIPSFTDVPKRAKLRLTASTVWPLTVKNEYDSEGEGNSLPSSDRYTIGGNLLTLDYFGNKSAGIELSMLIGKFKYKNEDENSNLELLDSKQSAMFGVTNISVYFMWNNFVFPVNNIKTSFGLGVGGINSHIAVDYLLTDRQVWSNKILIGSSYSSFNTKIIHNFSKDIAMSIGYKMGSESVSTHHNITVSGGYQFHDLKYGYYDFNVKIVPYLGIGLPGKETPKTRIVPGVSVICDFI